MKPFLILALSCVMGAAAIAQEAAPGPAPTPRAGENPGYRSPILADDEATPAARPVGTPTTPAASAFSGLEQNPEPPRQEPGAAAVESSGGQPTVIRADLDEDSPIPVPTSTIRTTTILFPVPVEDAHGTGFTFNPAKVRGDFFIGGRPGLTYLSITPLVEGTRRNLNVILKGRVYSLDVYPASPRGAAAFSVITKFKDAPGAMAAAPGPSAGGVGADSLRPESPVGGDVSRSMARPAPRGKPASAARLLSCLDACKLLVGVGDPATAAKAAQLMPDVTFVIRAPKDTSEFSGCRIEVTHTLRNSALDAVAFALLVTNTGKVPITLDATSFAVRAAALSKLAPGTKVPAGSVVPPPVPDPLAGKLYEAVTADVDAAPLDPGQSRRAWCLIAGGAIQGSRNNLDPAANRFFVTCELAQVNGRAPTPAPAKRKAPAAKPR